MLFAKLNPPVHGGSRQRPSYESSFSSKNHVCNPKSGSRKNFLHQNFLLDIVYVKQMDNENHFQSFAARNFGSSGRGLNKDLLYRRSDIRYLTVRILTRTSAYRSFLF